MFSALPPTYYLLYSTLSISSVSSSIQYSPVLLFLKILLTLQSVHTTISISSKSSSILYSPKNLF